MFRKASSIKTGIGDQSAGSSTIGGAFLELKQIGFSYPGKRLAVLSEINLSFEREGITAIIGPNGCGKTTLTKVMTGILPPSSGKVYLEGRCLQEYSLAQVGRHIGYVFQNPDQQLFCSSVAEEIGFGLSHRGMAPSAIREKVDYYLDYFELSSYRQVFPMNLSYGEKQRLVIAAVLASEPGFLILDEPTAGLDAYRKKLLAEQLYKVARLGNGIVMVSHDTAFVNQVAGRVIVLGNGRVQRDSAARGNDEDES